MERVPNLQRRLSAVLGRIVEPGERVDTILVELLETLEKLTAQNQGD